jgi:hypothetical protein
LKYTEEQIKAIYQKFLVQELSSEEWTHEAHLIVGICHLIEFGYYDAICRMRAGIILLNKSHQTTNTSQRGYHETLTIYWLNNINDFLAINGDSDLNKLVNLYLTSSFANKNLPFEYYGKEELMSAEARAIYIAPE